MKYITLRGMIIPVEQEKLEETKKLILLNDPQAKIEIYDTIEECTGLPKPKITLEIEDFVPVCTYCEEPNNIIRYDKYGEYGDLVCEKCGTCCMKFCLGRALNNSDEKFFHDYALLVMDGMYSEYYEFKKRTRLTLRDGVFRAFEAGLSGGGHKPWLPNYLPSLMKMIADMTTYREAYWQNGEWRPFS
jgi:hypothetical protein